MDSKKYEVVPNRDSTSRFLYKVTEVIVYDSGHTSNPIDVDFCETIHDAFLSCEKFNQASD